MEAKRTGSGMLSLVALCCGTDETAENREAHQTDAWDGYSPFCRNPNIVSE